jgi:signal transduction histidine kinase
LADLPEISSVLQRQADSTTQLIQRILSRAQLAAGIHSGCHFDLATHLPGLLDTLQRMYQEKNLSIATFLPEKLATRMDAQDMLELLGNLLDNACKWAKQEIRLTIKHNTVTASAPTATLEILIEDDGPGIPADAIDKVTRRGGRLDEEVEGHGMGLAIASDIVECYQGRLQLQRSETLGGLSVVVMLPSGAALVR